MGESSGADRVRVLFADQLNLARGKYVPQKFARKGHVRFCTGAYALTYARQLLPAPGAEVENGLPDMEAVYDPADFRKGWEPNTDLVVADMEIGGEPYGLCGRSALKRAIAAWEEHGCSPMLGFEGEAYIFQRGEDGGWVPYDTPGAFVYGTGPFTDPAGLIDDVWAEAERLGFGVESINSEFDYPQFELTLGYTDALTACDNFFLFRAMARELMLRRGYLLSFMPKPLLDRAGTGLHLNLSMSGRDGKNLFADGTGAGHLSPMVRGCIAGLVHHHEALGGLLAPTVNSYARLQPASLSGYWANWGYDHRGVAVRVSSETGPAARIEHRVADCAVSPYVAAAALLQAARLGFENGYDLPPHETEDGLENVSTERSIAKDLGASLDHLEADTALKEAIGALLIDNFVAIKRAEIEELDGATHEQIFEYYAQFL